MWDAVGKVIFKWLVMSDRVEEFNITSRADRSSLHIEHVTVMDEGMYYCVATDYQSQITKQFNVGVNGEQRSNRYLCLSLFVFN